MKQEKGRQLLSSAVLLYLACMPGGYRLNFQSASHPWELKNSKGNVDLLMAKVVSILQMADGCYHCS